MSIMSIKKSAEGGVMIIDNDSDRVIFEPALCDAGKITIHGSDVVVAERSDIEGLVRYLTEWLEKTPMPDGWYVMGWPGGRTSAIRVYGGAQYEANGRRIEVDGSTYIRRLGDLTPEDIATLKKEGM